MLTAVSGLAASKAGTSWSLNSCWVLCSQSVSQISRVMGRPVVFERATIGAAGVSETRPAGVSASLYRALLGLTARRLSGGIERGSGGARGLVGSRFGCRRRLAGGRRRGSWRWIGRAAGARAQKEPEQQHTAQQRLRVPESGHGGPPTWPGGATGMPRLRLHSLRTVRYDFHEAQTLVHQTDNGLKSAWAMPASLRRRRALSVHGAGCTPWLDGLPGSAACS